jgi:hypothetical protein
VRPARSRAGAAEVRPGGRTILSLLLVGGYGDIALRDFGLLLGGIALSRLAATQPEAEIGGRPERRSEEPGAALASR